MKRAVGVALLAVALGLLGCSQSAVAPAEPETVTPAGETASPVAETTVAETTAPEPAVPAQAPAGAQPQLATDPAQLADDLVADERLIRDPGTPEPALAAAARRQQAAYRAIGHHPEWDGTVESRIPAELRATYDRNIDARRQLSSMTPPRDTLPPWHIQPPAPAEELLGYYREAEAASGVGWNYLAAINLIETRLGSIVGDSTAGAQGPMQFLPSTFAGYGDGGDIYAPRDAILAAGRYLAANNFAGNPSGAIWHYNHADEYVRAVNDYAAVLAADPGAFTGYYRWDVYYKTTAGDVLLPIGYSAGAPIPVGEYLAGHPQ